MTLDEYIQNWSNMISEVEQKQPQLLLQLGNDALATIKDRVINSGIRADGKQFASPNNPSGYSRNPMLTNYTGFHVKSGYDFIAGSKKKRKELKWVTIKHGTRAIRLFILPGGYEQFRDLQGRRTDIVNFSFTNRMWANTQIKERTKDSVTIGPRNNEDSLKMEGLNKRFGRLLELSDAEHKKLMNNYRNSILGIMKKHKVA